MRNNLFHIYGFHEEHECVNEIDRRSIMQEEYIRQVNLMGTIKILNTGKFHSC